MLGAIASAIMGYFFTVQYTATKHDRDDANTRAQQATTQMKTAQAAQKSAEADAKAAQDKATADEAKLTDLNNQLTQAQADAQKNQAALQSAQSDLTAANDKYNKLMTSLGGKTVDDFNKDVADAQKQRDDAVAQQKVLQDGLDQANARIKELVDDINNANKHVEPPGVSGKVTFVDRTWNFVVLDVGLDAGVVPNGELIVYRGHNFLGKVRVTRADPNDAVAEILPDIKGQIEVGDAVLN